MAKRKKKDEEPAEPDVITRIRTLLSAGVRSFSLYGNVCGPPDDRYLAAVVTVTSRGDDVTRSDWHDTLDAAIDEVLNKIGGCPEAPDAGPP